jgi:hypothetical protein
MPHYRVFLNGRNFSLKVDDRVQRLGFFTFRVIEASDGAEAERLAIEMLRQDRWLREATLNDRSDPRTIHVEEVVEAEPPDEGEGTPGLSFYPSGDDVRA